MKEIGMDFSKKLCFPETIFTQEIDGEMVLLDMKSESYYGLDPVATQIWRILQEGKSLEETFRELLEIYDVEERRLRKDLETFVQHVIDQGLAKWS